MKKFSMIIKNAKVIDGTGSPWYKGDVGISNGKIALIGSIKDENADTVIDCENLVLSPGFIDTHSHVDINIFQDESVYNKLVQGITTDISGNCGLSLAPVSDVYFDEFIKYITFGVIKLKNTEKLLEFSNFSNFMNKVAKLSLGNNQAFFVGQGSLRICTMGFVNREATKDEMEKMKSILREAMEAGALGISSGLIYPPGVFTPKEELIELCKVVREYGGIYTSHIRNESYDVIDAVKEAIDIGRKSGIQVHISHHKIAGKSNWGNSVETLKLIEEAINEGIDVSLDQYPYTASQTILSVALPPEYHEGGTAKMVERISNVNNWDKIKEDILDTKRKWENVILLCGFENILILSASKTKEAEGKTIMEYANDKNIDSFEALFTILIQNEGNVSAAFFSLGEDDIESIMKYPYTMFGTDGGLTIPGLPVHPRYTGSFPRILGRYVRDRKVLSLEEAIRKMTSLPASKMGLSSKGLIKEGFDADLVIFNPETIIDRADYIDPFKKNEGIKYVIVNGEIAIKDNEYMNSGSGKVIRVNR